MSYGYDRDNFYPNEPKIIDRIARLEAVFNELVAPLAETKAEVAFLKVELASLTRKISELERERLVPVEVNLQDSCMITSNFKGGNGLGFFISPIGEAVLLAYQGRWKLAPGRYDDITLQVDSGTLWSGPGALVLEEIEHILILKVPIAFLREVSEGDILKICSDEWKEVFDLSGPKAALASTIDSITKRVTARRTL